MKKKLEKTLAMSVLLALGSTGCVFAAPTAEDTDARIAALEQQQQELAKELKALKSENKKLKNQSNSQKKQLNGMKSSVNEALNRVSLHGFGRVSWDNDNIKGYIDKNDNSRYYLDLEGKFQVNKDWSFNFQSETNHRYKKLMQEDGTVKYHQGHDDSDGVIQRVWAEGKIGVVNVDIGRRWRGLGFQNVLLGNETDGVVLSTPIPGSKLTGKAFVLMPTDEGYDFTLAGVGAQGQVGHGLQISVAAVKSNISRNDRMGVNVYDGKDPHDPRHNTAGSFGYVLSAMWNPMRNIFLIGDYARTNMKPYSTAWDSWEPAERQHRVRQGNDYMAFRVNYRWSNINDPGSFQLYSRYYNYSSNENDLVGMFGDKEWGLLQPGSHGWVFGFKYVPAKNIEWETMYEYATAHNGLWNKKDQTYHRNFLRTQIDYHF